jgi:RNA polymerase sigma factor (sigma-70 family)
MKGREENRRNLKVLLAMTETTPPEPHSLESLFRDYSRQVLKAAYRVTGSASDAEDAVQTVFVRLAKNGHVDRLGEQPGPYLKRAGTNAALDVLRRRRTAAVVEISDNGGPVLVADRRDEPDRQLANVDLSVALRRAMATLNERGSEIFVMHHIEGMSNPAIAAELQTSAAVIAVSLHRANRRVERQMKSFLGEK